jgi:ribonuclease P/MRP protein subunit POP5
MMEKIINYLESLASCGTHPNQSTSRLGSLTSPLDSKRLYKALKQSILASFGETGWGAVGMSLTGVPHAFLLHTPLA